MLGDKERDTMNTKIKMAMTIAAAAAMANALCDGAGTVNTSIWFDGSDQQVNTGGDGMYEYGVCETSTMGYWYDYDDRKNDNGGSYALYPFDSTGYYGSFVAPQIENLGYVAIQYVLVDPTTTGQTAEYPYNFVGFGFNTVGGSQDPLDISAAGGLCATYTTDNAVTLEVAETVSGDASCSITLAKASSPTTVDKAIEDFKQPTWVGAANKLESCAAAFAAAKAVKFKLDGGASDASGTLRIFEVGPKGTCTGAGSVSSAEPASFTCKSDGQGGANCEDRIAIKGVKAASAVKATLSGRTLSFSGISSDASFEIVSLQGQVVKSGKIASSVSLASINAGVYMVRVVGKSVNMAQKILVK